MGKSRIILVVVAVAVASFLVGAWYSHPSSSETSAASARRILYYACPMHPQYTSDRPGDAPCCGMRLEPVYADSARQPLARGSTPGSVPPGSIQISSAKQQLLGVRVAPVERSSGGHTVRTTGRVAADENRLYRLNASTELWVRKVYLPTTGSVVRKDEPLLDFYAANFLSAAASYMYALNTRDRQMAAKMTDAAQMDVVKFQIRQAVESLQNLGVSDVDIAEMERTRRPTDLVTLRSPIDGYVLSRTATMGQWIGASSELYQIADLSRIWILADLHGSEARASRSGTLVRVFSPNLKLSFDARVSNVPPAFDPVTRLMRVRLEAENPRRALWPGMFVDVEFPVELPAVAWVPADAVIDTGLRKTVFVDRGEGYFEPRLIETGWRFGDRVEVTEGLEPGERIVVAGNFLLDSESRMKTAAAGIQAPAKDPVCGMDVDRLKANAAGRTSQYQGTTYYFCADQCKRKFDGNPAQYAGGAAGQSKQAEGPAIDPVCGMDVDQADAKAAGRTSQHQGNTYYFCSNQCKKKFDQEPAKYVKKPQGSKPPSESDGIHI